MKIIPGIMAVAFASLNFVVFSQPACAVTTIKAFDNVKPNDMAENAYDAGLFIGAAFDDPREPLKSASPAMKSAHGANYTDAETGISRNKLLNLNYGTALVREVLTNGAGVPNKLTSNNVASVGDVESGRVAKPSDWASTWVMMILGFAGLGLAGYRKSKNGRAVFIAVRH